MTIRGVKQEMGTPRTWHTKTIPMANSCQDSSEQKQENKQGR